MEPSPNLRQGGPSSIEQVPLILLGSKEGSASISRKGGGAEPVNKHSLLTVPSACWAGASRHRRAPDVRMQAGVKHNRETIWKAPWKRESSWAFRLLSPCPEQSQILARGWTRISYEIFSLPRSESCFPSADTVRTGCALLRHRLVPQKHPRLWILGASPL